MEYLNIEMKKNIEQGILSVTSLTKNYKLTIEKEKQLYESNLEKFDIRLPEILKKVRITDIISIPSGINLTGTLSIAGLILGYQPIINIIFNMSKYIGLNPIFGTITTILSLGKFL